MNRTKMWENYLKDHPSLKEVATWQLDFEAFLQDHIDPIKLPEQDTWKELIKDGLPLLMHDDLHQEVVRGAAAKLEEVLGALADGAIALPGAMKAQVETLSAWAKKAGEKEREELFSLLLQQDDRVIGDFASANAIDATCMRVIGWPILSALIPAEEKEADFWQEDPAWRRNYCPVCGRQPVLAVLRKQANGHARFLVCDGCHTVWPHDRVGCVYCGNKDLKKIKILEPEQQSEMRLDVCDDCRTYLKTFQGKEEDSEEIYRHDWATLHLDILAAERGLTKKGSILLATAKGEET